MSADLHIHILDEAMTTREEVRYFNLPTHRADDPRWMEAYDHIAGTPNIWIGEVSWLKAWLFEDHAAFVPDPVNRVQERIGDDLVELTEELLAAILEAFGLPNTTGYSLANKEEVEAFLRPYVGHTIFTVSW